MIAAEPLSMPQVKRATYESSPSHFGVYTDSGVTWTGCRESLHDYVDGGGYTYVKNRYLYNIGSLTIETLDAFMTKLEAILGLTTPSIFHPVCAEEQTKLMGIPLSPRSMKRQTEIVVVEPSAWWRQGGTHNVHMRHQFFSSALRAALTYKPAENNFWQSIFTYKYFQPTSTAVARFLDGKTHYTGKTYGWHTAFHTYNNDQTTLMSLLVSPPSS